MPSRFDLRTRLAAPIKPQGVAFPDSSVNNLQDTSAKRRQVTIEVMRQNSETDETGGQTGGYVLAGQVSAWIQEFSSADESTPVIGNATENRRKYYVGVPHDADIRTEDELASPGWVNSWTPQTQVEESTYTIPLANKNSYLYESLGSGVTGSNEPLWPQNLGGQVVDGGMIWRNAGEIVYLNVLGDDAAKSTPAEKVLICEVMT